MGALAGKRVCTGERSRPFQGILLDKPLFGGIGIYDKIKWSPLGAVGCKDALLNGSVDAIPLRFMGLIALNDDGVFVTPKCAGGPATMEIINSGRSLHFIPMTEQQLGITKKIPGALVQRPIIFKKGAFEGLNQDIMGRAGPNGFLCDASLPDAIVKEIVRVWKRPSRRFRHIRRHAWVYAQNPLSRWCGAGRSSSRRGGGHAGNGVTDSQNEITGLGPVLARRMAAPTEPAPIWNSEAGSL